jgi:hypothetical protein
MSLTHQSFAELPAVEALGNELKHHVDDSEFTTRRGMRRSLKLKHLADTPQTETVRRAA